MRCCLPRSVKTAVRTRSIVQHLTGYQVNFRIVSELFGHCVPSSAADAAFSKREQQQLFSNVLLLRAPIMKMHVQIVDRITIKRFVNGDCDSAYDDGACGSQHGDGA